MEIRLLFENDIDDLLDLYNHYTHKSNLPSLDDSTIIKIWNQIKDNSLIHYFVGTVDEKMIASCILTITPSFIRGGDAFGIIEHVVVHSEYRRRGYGKKIVNHALNTAWERNCTEVMLLSGSQNENAHKMYEQIGFDKNRKKGFILFHSRLSL